MKKNNISRSFAALLMGCAMFMVSCEEADPEKPIEPSFPTTVTKTVSPGEEVALTFTANMDWEVSVPKEGIQWFWIQDGAIKVDKCSGSASERQVTVYVGVSKTEEFSDSRKCKVTLTMGGQSKVIAELERPAKQRTLTMYSAKVADGEIQFVEDGSTYDYNAEEAESIDLIWTGTDFRLPIKVESNYSWTVKTPDWARIDVPEKSAGTVTVNVYGVPSAYPEEAAEGKILFMAGETVVKEYGITIPGCKDIFSYSLDMGQEELDFNFSGQIKTAMGYVDGPIMAEIHGTSEAAVFAVELVDGAYAVNSVSGPSWLVIDTDDYDSSEGADVLQYRDVTISASLNEGEDRKAVIFFMPPTVSQRGAELFNADLDTVKEEFAQYAVSVIQHSSNQEFIQMIANASDMAVSGAVFTVSEDEGLYTKFGQTRFAYELVYSNQYSRDNARMMFTSAVTSVKVFNESGVEDTESEGFLSITLDEDKKGGVIDMIAETESVGYVVLYGATDNVLAVVKCTYDPETVIGEVVDVAFIGESAELAHKVGATLTLCQDGKVDGEYYRQAAEEVYHLRYTMEGYPLKISIPNTAVMHTVNGWSIHEYIRVNNIVYTKPVNGRAGGFERIDGGIDIYMDMPAGSDFLRGQIVFMNAQSDFVLTIVCTLDLTGSAE